MTAKHKRATDPADDPLPAEAQSAAGRPPGVLPPNATNTSGFHVAVPQRHHVESHPTGKRLTFLSLGALGIVYGDIGTSPLYALQQCFTSKTFAIAPTPANVYGILSLIVWLLVLVVAVKYIVFIMRADNRGEGGILALLALILQQERRSSDSKRRMLLVVLGLFGAALLYGDGIITPAISVLSAMEGLNVATPVSENVIVGLSVVILFALFTVQRFGTGRVGVMFGPIMALWFLTISALGIGEILQAPRILAALNPWHGVQFFLSNRHVAFLTLGAVVLAVTGAEALYADMGHFGRRPIRIAWFALVLPALLLNYMGQGALLLRDPSAVANPFYLLAPHAMLIPLVVLATMAAVIASQALISGAFSLTQQAVQLGYSPRVTVVHTSKSEAGQIFIPEINRMLMLGCLLLVITFKSSIALGAAYGIAVTGTMAITSILFYVVARGRWNWSLAHVLPITLVFLAVDLTLFAANVIKIENGGWVPIVIAIGVFTLMSTWKKGRNLLNQALHAGALPLDLFLGDVERRKPPRVPGTAVFMTSSNDGVPVVLLHHLKHNKVLHEQVILMSVVTHEVPEIKASERVSVEKLEHGFYRVTARYGFMEQPNVPEILQWARDAGIKAKTNETTFYLGRERIIIADGERKPGTRRAPDDAVLPHMARWRKKLFVVMSRNARSATEFFGIPPNRVVELGAQVEF
ncbi:MAG: Low affinity potassium transport system protein kup [Gemmatimonadetes bacterium]|jgi:KUP system potassium uptake protein|nr:Low affinity potassium transport system protein kup [Gemmatimonadota bacterium]